MALAAEGAVGEAAVGSELPTFLNRGSPSPGSVPGSVTEGGGAYRLPSGQVPAGSFNFVRQNGHSSSGAVNDATCPAARDDRWDV